MDGAMAWPVKANCDQQGVVPILQKIFHKFGEKIETMDSQKRHEPDFIIETVRGSEESNSDFNTMDVYGENEMDDIREVKMSQYVASLILDCLHKTHEKQQTTTKLLVPDDLPQRVADDVMRMALDEPCGVRGCSLSVILEDGEICQRLGKIVVDPSTVTTFEIILVLSKDTPRWLVSKLQMYLRNSYDRPTVVKSSYKLIKRKLYRRESHMYIREDL